MAHLQFLKLTYSLPDTPMCYFRLLTFEVIGGSFDEMPVVTDKHTTTHNKYPVNTFLAGYTQKRPQRFTVAAFLFNPNKRLTMP